MTERGFATGKRFAGIDWRRAPQLLSIALLILLAGCGRVGVVLLPASAASATPTDASTAANGGGDAAIVGGSIGNNQLIDAGPAIDAAVMVGQDASHVQDDAATVADGGGDSGSRVADGGSDGGVLNDAGPAPAPCAGTRLLGLCWYLGAPSTSCNQNCAKHGGFDSRSISDVGTTSQGGSLRTCTQILVALGEAAPVVRATRRNAAAIRGTHSNVRAACAALG